MGDGRFMPPVKSDRVKALCRPASLRLLWKLTAQDQGKRRLKHSVCSFYVDYSDPWGAICEWLPYSLTGDRRGAGCLWDASGQRVG
jgi:hypothetical protein